MGLESRVSGAVPRLESSGQDVFPSLSLDPGGCLHPGLTAPSCVFTAHHSCLCVCSHVFLSPSLSCPYFTRTRMITLNHVENAKIESPHVTILNFILSAKSPPLLCKRRDSQGLGLGPGHSSFFRAEDSEYCGVRTTRGSILELVPRTLSQGPFLPQCRHKVFAEAKSSISKFCSLHLRPLPGLSL